MLYAEILVRLLHTSEELTGDFWEWANLIKEFEVPVVEGSQPVFSHIYCIHCRTLHDASSGSTTLLKGHCLECSTPEDFYDMHTTKAKDFRSNHVAKMFITQPSQVKLAIESILVRENNFKKESQ